MSDGTKAAADAVVSPATQAQISALLSSLSDCSPSPSDSVDLFFHCLIDRLLHHQTTASLDAFSPSLTSHAEPFASLIRLLCSVSSPSSPSPALPSLLSPLPSSLSTPLLAALTVRHAALHSSLVSGASAVSPAPLLSSFDVSVRLITSSAHLAVVRTPTVVLTLSREGLKEENVELSTAQLDALLDQLEAINRALMTV